MINETQLQIAVDGWREACMPGVDGIAGFLIDVITWLDWCLYAYWPELAFTVVVFFLSSCYLKGMPPLSKSKMLKQGLLKQSIICWVIYCLMAQPFPAVG